MTSNYPNKGALNGMHGIISRAMLAPLFVVLCMWLSVDVARAQTEIDITRGNIKAIPIAITPFISEGPVDPSFADGITKVISQDLANSGLFRAIEKAAFIEQISNVNKQPRFSEWRVINAQALVVGRVLQAGNGRTQVEFRLWDVFSGRQLAGKKFTATGDNWRRVAHIIADAIYERLTGEAGYFDTKVVFVEESGPKDKRMKRLAIMDQDGFNLRVLSSGKSLVLTPRFSPTGQLVTFMSYDGGRPQVYLLNIATGGKELVGDFPNMTFAPRFAPDGRSVALSLQNEGASDIHVMNLQSRKTRQLTFTPSIDTAPCFSPDGKRIVFESDRDGSQQLYVMNGDGSGQKRISYGGGRYSTPVWSPRGDLIAFTKQTQGRFLIGVMKPDGSGERILTGGYHNEGPTWAPNGRVLMFFRESPGARGGPKLYSIDLTGYNERLIPTPRFASDPAWSGRVN